MTDVERLRAQMITFFENEVTLSTQKHDLFLGSKETWAKMRLSYFNGRKALAQEALDLIRVFKVIEEQEGR